MFCLLGYRGKGYSERFCENMTGIYETLRLHPETLVEIVEGPDDICKAFPQDQHAHCENESVYRKDRTILDRIGVAESALAWSEICERVAQRVVPEDIRRICHDCQWEPLGLCRDGVRLITQNEPLPKILSK